jgi:hypothetical protein
VEAKRTRRIPAEGVGAVVEDELVIPGEALLFEDGEWFIVCEDTGYPVESYEGAFLVGPDGEWCEQAVRGARACWCSNSVRFLASVTTGKAFALPCLSWSCEKCNRRKWHAARELFRLGIESAWAKDERVRFLTLTVERGDISAAELAACWNRLALTLRRGGPAPARPKKPKRLRTVEQREEWKKRYEQWQRACRRRRSYLDQYAAVIELGEKTGRIHMHVLFTGRYVGHKRLGRMAAAAGFGRVSYITLVRNNGDAAKAMAAYAGKMASYTAKASAVAESLRARGSTRVRPVRTSSAWLAGGLRGVEEEKGIRKKKRAPGDPEPEDRGPWAMIELDGSGRPRWRRTIGDPSVLPRASQLAA